MLEDAGDFPIAADVVGDERPERIGRRGGRVIVCRPPAGSAPSPCQHLDYGPDARIEGIEAHDIFGRAHQDLIVRYWHPTQDAEHLVLDVLTPRADDELQSVFRHEISVYLKCCGSEANAPPHVRDDVRIARGAIEVRAERAWRLSEHAFHEPPLGNGVRPVVTPWDRPSHRRYVVRAGQLVLDPP